MSLINRISSYFSSASSTTRRRAKALGHVTTESLEVRTFPSVVTISLFNGTLGMTAGDNLPHYVRMYRANGAWEINGDSRTQFVYGGATRGIVRLPANVSTLNTVTLNFQRGENDVQLTNLTTASHVIYRGSPLSDKFVLDSSPIGQQTLIGGGVEFHGGALNEVTIGPGAIVNGRTALSGDQLRVGIAAAPQLTTQLMDSVIISGTSPTVTIASHQRGFLTVDGGISVHATQGQLHFDMLGQNNEGIVSGHDQPSLQVRGNVTIDGTRGANGILIGSDVQVNGTVNVFTGSGGDRIQVGLERQGSRYGALKISGALNINSGSGYDYITVGEFGAGSDFDPTERTEFAGPVSIVSSESMSLLVGLADFSKSLAVMTGKPAPAMSASSIIFRGGQFGTVVVIATGTVEMHNDPLVIITRSPQEELRFNSGILVMIDGLLHLGTRNGAPVRFSQSPNHRITVIGTPSHFRKSWLVRYTIPPGLPFALYNMNIR